VLRCRDGDRRDFGHRGLDARGQVVDEMVRGRLAPRLLLARPEGVADHRHRRLVAPLVVDAPHHGLGRARVLDLRRRVPELVDLRLLRLHLLDGVPMGLEERGDQGLGHGEAGVGRRLRAPRGSRLGLHLVVGVHAMHHDALRAVEVAHKGQELAQRVGRGLRPAAPDGLGHLGVVPSSGASAGTTPGGGGPLEVP
jgi:hypothetical protein